jgi:branched-chain amino acid aminotransferase
MSKFDETLKIWFSGKMVDWKDATVHVCAHVIHYGSAQFEGIRCYNTAKGSAVFRLMEHIKRLFNSAKIYRMQIPFTEQQVFDACLETIRVNKQKEAYIRPVVFRGYDSLGVDPADCPIETIIVTWKWGKYLGPEALTEGVDVCVSSWTRMAPNTFPALAKCSANYMNSQLIKLEAIKDGYKEGIALDANGYVSEGSGENLFLIMNGKIFTPPLGASVLPGITRDSVIKIARDIGYEVCEQLIPREMLYICDELFFTGTASEVSPIRSVDRIQVGAGRIGPLTQKIQNRFFDIIEGRIDDPYGWLTFVY